MADWLDVWSILGKEQGLELDMFEPVRMTVGGVKDPQKLSNLIPVMWVSSGLMDQGELEIHKQFFLGNLFKEPLVFYPSDYMPNAGLRDTLKYLAQMVRDANERGVESLAKQVLALFTAASIHEYEDSYFRGFKGESDEAEKKIEEWLTEHQPFRFAWHRRSRTLGPNQSFLEPMDFYEVLGTERPASIKELCQVIISGHRRVLDQYQLVIPSFQYEFRDEFESDLLDWWEDLQAREEKAAVQRKAIRAARAAKEQLHHERLEQKRRALLSPEKRNQEFPPLSWQNTSNERLQELLFEAPMTELAVRFSVSEAAIRKRVKSAGLSVPPRGHWLKKD